VEGFGKVARVGGERREGEHVHGEHGRHALGMTMLPCFYGCNAMVLGERGPGDKVEQVEFKNWARHYFK
jgi:hypothetical protein